MEAPGHVCGSLRVQMLWDGFSFHKLQTLFSTLEIKKNYVGKKRDTRESYNIYKMVVTQVSSSEVLLLHEDYM